jgi:hypothetical protein
MHKDGEENKNAIKKYQNCIHQYKGYVLVEPEVGHRTLGFC